MYLAPIAKRFRSGQGAKAMRDGARRTPMAASR
jgi:hypothetical protein